MPDQIRRARATVGLPDSARITSPTQKNWVSPNKIRAERSEQEVAAIAFFQHQDFHTHSAPSVKPSGGTRQLQY